MSDLMKRLTDLHEVLDSDALWEKSKLDKVV